MAMTAPVHAQTGEVVQATPSAEAVAALNRHLATLSRSPQDVNALLGAGQAALDLGDVQAANGFFTRANMVNPRLGKAKLGLAVVQIALKQPADAAANFDAAAALGEGAGRHLSDRALAYDLTGQHAKAQQDYQAALRADPGDGVAQARYAVSLGLVGHWAEADRQLATALAAGDREAWRMRAFIHAMNGRIGEARKITQSIMPKGLADAIDPYLQRLPLLTPTQKAAAVHYGEYPANVLRLAAPEPARDRDVQIASAGERDAPARRDRRSRTSADRRAVSASRAPAPSAASAAPAARVEAPPPPAAPIAVAPAPPPVAMTPPASAAAPARPVDQPVQVAVAVQPARSAPPQAAGAPPVVQPAARTAPATATAAPAPAMTAAPAIAPAPVAARQQGPLDPQASPAPAPAPGFSPPAQPLATVPASQPPRSLAETLSTLDVPEAERQQTTPAADMAAVARIQAERRRAAEAAAAKAKAAAEAKAKAEAARKAEAERKARLAANPSRNWVQIATGRDVDALAFDLRRLRRTYGEAVGEMTGWTAQWGATRRLLIGPYKRVEDARAVVGKIAKSGGDAFLWQSEAGEEVAQIGGK
jgi:tetratricopeptide (TPR) repeat protein